jgi:tetratricopeptide (TPR) repeat protein
MRTRSYLLGDQQVWLDCFRAHDHRLFSEPLAAGIWYGYVALLEAAKLGLTPPILAVLPALCGAAAALLMWRIAGLIVPPGKSRMFAFLLLGTLGIAQLYCGYIESYPIASLAVLAFVWLGLRQLRSGSSVVLAALSFLVAVASHLAALYLLPAYLHLVFRARKEGPVRVALALVPLLVGVPLVLGLSYRGSEYTSPFHTLWVALEVAARAGRASGAASVLGPVSDLINLCALVLPVPLLILIAGARERSFMARWDSGSTFLATLAGTGLLMATALVIPGSPAQDWDLMSLFVLPLAILVASRLDALPPLRDSTQLRHGILAIAAASALAFVLVNADAKAAVGRFKVLLAPRARLSVHERAYGNEKLMVYYAGQGARDSALVYAGRALEADSTNGRYWTNLGLWYYRLGRYEEAIPRLEEALRRDPTRWTARFDLGLCYLSQERYPIAAEELAMAARTGGDRPDVLHSLGMALYRAGKPDSALTVWREVLARWPQYAEELRRRQGPPPGSAEGTADPLHAR